MVMDDMDSFSDEAGDTMEEVYQYMMQKHHMHLLGCTEGQKKSVRQKATKFVICHCFTKVCNVTLQTKLQETKTIALKRGLYLARGGTILAIKSCL